MANNFSLSANAAIVDPQTGQITPQFYRYLLSLNKTAGEAGAGEIATAPGSGLTGGGTVADGVNLAIADQGVTSGMLRYGAGTSVIGRSAGSTGAEADISAVVDGAVLQRKAGVLVFDPALVCDSVETDSLRINGTATAGTPTATFTTNINIGGTVYKVLLTT
jgi:hypothetical protein